MIYKRLFLMIRAHGISLAKQYLAPDQHKRFQVQILGARQNDVIREIDFDPLYGSVLVLIKLNLMWTSIWVYLGVLKRHQSLSR